jgi:hypothetical protein
LGTASCDVPRLGVNKGWHTALSSEIGLPPDSLHMSKFTQGCFDKSGGILHYALPHASGHAIIVWTLEDYAHNSWNWTVKCHLDMRGAFGSEDLVYYDDGDIGNDSKWFWRCDYRILALDLEREFAPISGFKWDRTSPRLSNAAQQKVWFFFFSFYFLFSFAISFFFFLKKHFQNLNTFENQTFLKIDHFQKKE